MSVRTGGAQGNSYSSWPSISADGRFVAFTSYATNLVPGDTNLKPDVFVRDRQTGTTARVSLGPGVQGDDDSYAPSISADGRFVAFQSGASNLVPGDTNNFHDVFVFDRMMGKTQRISVGSGGIQGIGFSYQPAISADGRFVAFSSGASNLVPDDSNGDGDVFVHDRKTGIAQLVSRPQGAGQSNGVSDRPTISANGRFVAFESGANNLVPGDTNDVQDVFVRDRQTGRTERVSVRTGGAQGNSDSQWPSISANGRYVAFQSYATNLVPGDTNGVEDAFVRDRQTGTTRRVSVGSGSVQGNKDSGEIPKISADGRFVAFSSLATNLVPADTNKQWDVFVRILIP